MDVTRENFAELLPLIRESIAQAEFIGFDTEFSGIIHYLNAFQVSMLDPMIDSTITIRLRTDTKS